MYETKLFQRFSSCVILRETITFYFEGGGLMDKKEFSTVLSIGETVAVEFKRAGNGVENDTYERCVRS